MLLSCFARNLPRKYLEVRVFTAETLSFLVRCSFLLSAMVAVGINKELFTSYNIHLYNAIMVVGSFVLLAYLWCFMRNLRASVSAEIEGATKSGINLVVDWQLARSKGSDVTNTKEYRHDVGASDWSMNAFLIAMVPITACLTYAVFQEGFEAIGTFPKAAIITLLAVSALNLLFSSVTIIVGWRIGNPCLTRVTCNKNPSAHSVEGSLVACTLQAVPDIIMLSVAKCSGWNSEEPKKAEGATELTDLAQSLQRYPSYTVSGTRSGSIT